MTFTTADYAVAATAAASAVFGLFGGFSGALAFLAGMAAAVAAVRFGWGPLEAKIGATWMLAVAAMLVALVAFGLARVVVKKVVKNMLAQPADALLGFSVAAVSGTGLALLALYAARRLGVAALPSSLLDLALSMSGA